MCEKREKRLDRSLPRSPRTRSASPPDARASPHAATWPVSGINSQLLREGLVRHRKVVSRQKLASTALWRMLEDRQSLAAGRLNPLDLANQPGPGDGVAAETSLLGGAGGTVPRWMLLLAASLAFGIAVIVALGVIPPVRTDTFAGARPGAAATTFAVNAILNVLVGIALLAAVPWRSGGAGKVLIVVAGVVGLLLGSALLDAAGAFMGHGPGMRTAVVICFAGAAGDLGAGVLVLIAAFRGQRKFREE